MLALVCIGLAIFLPKGRINKLAWTAAALVVFSILPIKAHFERQELAAEKKKRDAYAAEAWAYFRKLCAEKAGEKIYKTVTGVKSVLVTKPLPPATEKDLSDQFWAGDPYSNATPHKKRAESAAFKLASLRAPISPGQFGPGFDFVESYVFDSSMAASTTLRFMYRDGNEVAEPVDRPVSRYGLSWSDISTNEERRYWIAGSRLQVMDLQDGSLIAERTGFLIEPGFGSKTGQRTPWLAGRGPRTTCPEAHDYSDRWFVLKVLKPN